MPRDLYLMEHPAALLPSRSPELRDLMGLDLRRVGRLSTGWRPESYRDDFQGIQAGSDLAAWVRAAEGRLALDLETGPDGLPDMVGLASSPERACLVAWPMPELLPLLKGRELLVHYGEGLEVDWLLDVLGDDFESVVVHDLHKLFHALDPEYASAGRDKGPGGKRGGGSGALAFIQSVYSWRPYHKHLLKVAAGDFAKKAHYCMLDCVVEWECFHRVWAQLEREAPQALEAYQRDAVPLLPAMVRMSRKGLLVDRERFERRRGELAQEVGTLGDALIAEYGEGVRPKGKKTKWSVNLEGVKAVLTQRGVKLPKKRDPETGEMRATLDREARQKLVGEYAELELLSDYLGQRDILTDFYKGAVVGRDGVCRPHWSGYLASWRWRVTEPNVAQHPGRERVVFVARPGHRLVELDTEAGEYRWFAGECQDPTLLAELAEFDRTREPMLHPHVIGTAVAFNVAVDQALAWKQSHDPKLKARYTFSKNNAYRRLYAYRGGIASLKGPAAKAGLRWSQKLFADLDREWFKRYPQAGAWRDRHVAQATQTRIVTCREWGYTRRLHGQGSEIENAALNHPMQAGIAGIINRTIRETWAAHRLLPLVNMHDGLLYEVPEITLVDLVAAIQVRMTQSLVTLDGLVIPVEVKVGASWGELEEWKP